MIAKKHEIIDTLRENRWDALVLHSPQNRRYLTGVRSSAGAVVITAAAQIVFVTDFRYITAARKALEGTCIACEMVEAGGENAWIGEYLREKGCSIIAVEDQFLTAAQMEELKALWTGELVTAGDLLMRIRRAKTEGELAKIQAAQAIAEQSLAQTLEIANPGVTERQIAAYLTWRLLENGSENGVFGIVVASGPNSALPHAMPTDRALQRGDFLLIDFGAIYDGYYSDITRTVAIRSADDEMRRVYDVVLEANQTAITTIRPGIGAADVDAAARVLIQKAGFGSFFGHGLGHGVGLDIHEKPALRQCTEDILQINHVVTVEPGIYLPGRFGVRIEDLLAVTEDGCRNMTKMNKELMIL